MRAWGLVTLAACCVACSAGDTSGALRSEQTDAQDIAMLCTGAERTPCSCPGGASGSRICQAGRPGACECEAEPTDTGFGNSQTPTPQGSAGDAADVPREVKTAPEDCGAGFYLGTYSCDLDFAGLVTPLAGDVSFNLEINEELIDNECDAEFCPDLVIAEGSGTLFGLAGFWGFEAPLRGGLDCSTRELRTDPLDGIWGFGVSSDPADPDALWTVQQPPSGNFMGDLAGMHLGGTPQKIEGDWDLAEDASGISCAGMFSVTRQP